MVAISRTNVRRVRRGTTSKCSITYGDASLYSLPTVSYLYLCGVVILGTLTFCASFFLTTSGIRGSTAVPPKLYSEEDILRDYKELGFEGLTPDDRMKEYREKFNWPPRAEDFIPNTEGWRNINERRFRQIALNPDPEDSYDGLQFVVHSALTSPNFTEHGWGLSRAPKHILDVLQEYLQEGLEEMKEYPVYEQDTDVDNDRKQPYFIDIQDIADAIVEDLLPLHEAWTGGELKGHNAYGLRVYREGSKLDMHIDKPLTHIISSILHVGHSEDMESWPIVIEDFHGNTNEVHLQAGKYNEKVHTDNI